MPLKYVHRDGLPILLRHTGPTTLPQDPPPAGDGRPVLCLHDAGLASSVFDALLATVAPDGGAIAFDLPGHGRSGSLDALPSIGAMRELAQWVAERCGLERPVLVGHGMGALVALDWAADAPGSIGGLVLCGVGTALGISDEAIGTMQQVTLGKAPRPFDPTRVCRDGGREMMQKAFMLGLETDPRATLVDLQASRAFCEGIDTAAAAVDCAATVAAGAAEPDACRERAVGLAERLGASATTIDGAAHFLPLEQPGALADVVRPLREAA